MLTINLSHKAKVKEWLIHPQLTHDKDNTTMMQMYLAHDANVPKPRGQGKGMATSPKLIIVLIL